MRRASHGTFAELKAHVTLSLGVAAFPRHAPGPEALMDAAHRALLAAKELGRDRSAVFSTEIDRVLGPGLAGGPGPGLRMAAVVALAEALDLRDTGTTTHSRTVGRAAFVTARELGLPATRCERLRLAGVLHDIGMVAVPAEIVARMDGPLENEELAELHRHPEVGARLLAGPAFADLRDWIAAHHERLDGSGYPLGLTGDAIPIEAQVIGAADVWEELVREHGDEDAREALRACAGTAFDPAVVGALLRSVRGPGAVPNARGVRHH
jgi:HD-GYP domain-containing protein (c-di-GMP phosphodiesterase class II)